MALRNYFVATLACILSVAVFVFYPAEVHVGGNSDSFYYEPVPFLTAATLSLIAICAGVRSVRSVSPHRVAIAFLVLPVSILVFALIAYLSISRYQHFP